MRKTRDTTITHSISDTGIVNTAEQLLRCFPKVAKMMFLLDVFSIIHQKRGRILKIKN